MTSTPGSPALIDALVRLVGVPHVLADEAGKAPYLTDWRGRYRGAACCVVRPGSTDEVAAVVRACVAAGVPVVPQGGNTGLCGGATPDESGSAVVVALGRLNRVLAVDPKNSAIFVQAGCTLAQVQAAAAAADCLFPLALASEGSCQIGGNLSTNAGGVQVLRYGTTRELTLGLEVVLPDGTVWNGLRALRKDNTGYDLKQWFIGAEGTLGIITAAALKLFPRPAMQVTGWLNVSSPASAVALLQRARAAFDAQLTAFELVSETALDLVLRHIPGSRRPTAASPWYVLAEFSGTEAAAAEAWLAEALADGQVSDGVLARSGEQVVRLWALRENIAEAQKIEGFSLKHDIAVPVSCLAGFLEQADQALAAFPGVRVVAFGHVGDGNLHYNVSMADAADNVAFLGQQAAVARCVYDLVDALGGSFSAEHGIGQLKRDALAHYRSPVDLALMRSLKQSLDPHGLMNPGKVV